MVFPLVSMWLTLKNASGLRNFHLVQNVDRPPPPCSVFSRRSEPLMSKQTLLRCRDLRKSQVTHKWKDSTHSVLGARLILHRVTRGWELQEGSAATGSPSSSFQGSYLTLSQGADHLPRACFCSVYLMLNVHPLEMILHLLSKSICLIVLIKQHYMQMSHYF